MNDKVPVNKSTHLRELEAMFASTPFNLKIVKDDIFEYSSNLGKLLTRRIIIDFGNNKISYIRSTLLVRGKSKTVDFEKLSDIKVPKTFDEFDEIVGWV